MPFREAQDYQARAASEKPAGSLQNANKSLPSQAQVENWFAKNVELTAFGNAAAVTEIVATIMTRANTLPLLLHGFQPVGQPVRVT
jgi:hypothetical protein